MPMSINRIARRIAACLLVSLCALLGNIRSADAKVRVVTTVETFADLARRVGGDLVEVQPLGRGTMDPHFVEAKPSLQILLNRADLLVHVGLDLEIGWLPPLLVGARNSKILNGTPGNLNVSQNIPVLDLPKTQIDRSMGDIHPMGNPHYWIPPDNAVIIAGEIADRLCQLDPAHANQFQSNLSRFKQEISAHKVAWEKEAAPLKGLKIVTYHKSWSYVSQWLGMEEVGYVEPKPGIPPPLSHLYQLVGLMRQQKVKVVVVETFYSRKTAEEVARLSGGKLAILPSDVGARGDVKDYFALVDAVVKGIVEAAK